MHHITLLQTVGEGISHFVNYEIYFWVLMVLNLTFIALAKTLNQDYISTLFGTAIINRQLLQKTQEELKLNSASSILLTLTYFINISALFSYLAFEVYDVFMWIVLGILLGAALIKWLVMWSLMFFTQNKSGVGEHGMNHLIYYQVGGLILTPILILSHFLPDAIHMYVVLGCLIFAGLLLIVRELQSIGRAFKARVSSLYIILYLCTLELMPLVLIIYVFVNNYAGLN